MQFDPAVREYIDRLINEGYEVYTNDRRPKPRWFYIVKEDKIGYFQYSQISGFCFGTVHKPCKEAGTGFRVATDVDGELKYAEWALGYPTGFGTLPSQVRKYKNWAEFEVAPISLKPYVKIGLTE